MPSHVLGDDFRIPLLLLPGTLTDSGLFAHQTAYLADVAEIAVGDLTQGSSIADMAQAVLSNAPPRFALAGLSLGGIVSLEIMRRSPERVERLALLDTTPLLPRPDQLETWDKLAALARDGKLDLAVDHLLPGLLSHDSGMDSRAAATIREMAIRVGPEAFIRQLNALAVRPESVETLSSIKCPTVVLAGRLDSVTPPSLHREMALAIPGSALVIVDQCGHLSPMDQPQAVTAVLRYWLQIGHGARDHPEHEVI
jgi:pimeloyl-ACP methyl ester carboxylesterase